MQRFRIRVAEFDLDMLAVALDRFAADAELFRDLTCAVPNRDKCEHRHLAIAEDIEAVLSNNSVRLVKSMRGAAHMVPRVAANNCDQPLLANDGIADCHDPAWLCARARCCAFFHSSRV